MESLSSENLHALIVGLIGLDGAALGAREMIARAVIVFMAALLMVRIGHKRFMGRNTTLDVLLGIVLGSILSRAITGNAPFGPTIAAGFALVCLHWLLAAIGFYWEPFNRLTMGRERCLISNGELNTKQLRHSHIVEADLRDALRNMGEEGDIDRIERAYLERSGRISIILKKNEAKDVTS